MQRIKKRIRMAVVMLVFLSTLIFTGCYPVDPGEVIPTPTPTPSTNAGVWGESRFGEAVFGP
jgi:hypothetical protein